LNSSVVGTVAIEVRKIAGKKAAPEFNNFARVGHASLAEFCEPPQPPGDRSRIFSGRNRQGLPMRILG
jgi:hypothetical protein